MWHSDEGRLKHKDSAGVFVSSYESFEQEVRATKI